jgi:hypothetical protein
VAEEEKVIAEMTEGGVLAALRWAAVSAYTRAWADFDPETGHSQTVLGITAHTLLADRQDRVFRLDKYTPADDGRDRDVVLAGLLPSEQESLPDVAGVTRADLNGSPAWQFGEYRWFVSSFEHGRIHDIAWGRKSPTKRRIAAQTGTDSPDQFVLPGTYDEPAGYALDLMTVSDLLEASSRHSVVSIVLTHSIDPRTGAIELFLGRPRLNLGGGTPWVWLHPLLPTAGSVAHLVAAEATTDHPKSS